MTITSLTTTPLHYSCPKWWGPPSEAWAFYPCHVFFPIFIDEKGWIFVVIKHRSFFLAEISVFWLTFSKATLTPAIRLHYEKENFDQQFQNYGLYFKYSPLFYSTDQIHALELPFVIFLLFDLCSALTIPCNSTYKYAIPCNILRYCIIPCNMHCTEKAGSQFQGPSFETTGIP